MTEKIGNAEDFAKDLVAALDSGDLSTLDQREWLTAIIPAARIHVERERIRHGLWKDYDSEDQLRQVFIKADRVRKIYEHASRSNPGGLLSAEQADEVQKELDDIINYSIFGKRQLNAESRA